MNKNFTIEVKRGGAKKPNYILIRHRSPRGKNICTNFPRKSWIKLHALIPEIDNAIRERREVENLEIIPKKYVISVKDFRDQAYMITLDPLNRDLLKKKRKSVNLSPSEWNIVKQEMSSCLEELKKCQVRLCFSITFTM